MCNLFWFWKVEKMIVLAQLQEQVSPPIHVVKALAFKEQSYSKMCIFPTKSALQAWRDVNGN